MRFGVGLENYGRNNSFDVIRRVALAAEELGYDSVWTTDHIIVPRLTVEPYGHILECLVTLAMVSSITRRVQLGTSVVVLPMRHPVLFAKQVATIDAATGGRMIVGLGVGRHEGEFRNLGANFKNRGKRLDEDITLLRTLWSREQVQFDGKFTKIEDAVFAPTPARKQIPIWIGGNTEYALRRAALLGDGWHPNGVPLDQFVEGADFIRERIGGRPFTFAPRFSIDMNPNIPSTIELHGSLRRRLSGTDEDIRTALRDYVRAGAEHIALFFPMNDVSTALTQMERFRKDIAPEFITITTGDH
jgi:probable F420-dependent oxidoreductase